MGRRRRQKVIRRPQKRIPDVYACPNCGEVAIKIEVYQEEGIATVRCGSCGLDMTIEKVTSLTEPVDVYGTFVDRFSEMQRSE
ncbi:MAG: hypothetical protein QXS20_00935 [Candidatus Thorarchaeota archaeon]